MKELDRLQKLLDRNYYQANFQFWGKGRNNFYISKGPNQVDIHCGGDYDNPIDAVREVISWIKKVNKKIK